MAQLHEFVNEDTVIKAIFAYDSGCMIYHTRLYPTIGRFIKRYARFGMNMTSSNDMANILKVAAKYRRTPLGTTARTRVMVLLDRIRQGGEL